RVRMHVSESTRMDLPYEMLLSLAFVRLVPHTEKKWEDRGMKRTEQTPVRAKAASRDDENITALLEQFDGGNAGAGTELMPRIYAHLRRIAASHLRRERAGHTLQPTALIHELYIRLIRPGKGPWKNRAHFFGIASRAMRQILIEHARARGAAKRGGL